MKEILRKMFAGWCLHENSWDGQQYTKDKVDCMIEACGGDKLEGELIYLFDYWSNDIQSVAAFYGIGLDSNEERGVFIVDVPPPPSPEHWWDGKKWQEPFNDKTAESVA